MEIGDRVRRSDKFIESIGKKHLREVWGVIIDVNPITFRVKFDNGVRSNYFEWELEGRLAPLTIEGVLGDI